MREKTVNNEKFTFYDIQPTDHDKKYIQLKEDISDFFDLLRDKDIVYTCDRLEKLQSNMDDDLGLVVAVMSAPLHMISDDKKSDFWEKYRELVKSENC